MPFIVFFQSNCCHVVCNFPLNLYLKMCQQIVYLKIGCFIITSKGWRIFNRELIVMNMIFALSWQAGHFKVTEMSLCRKKQNFLIPISFQPDGVNLRFCFVIELSTVDFDMGCKSGCRRNSISFGCLRNETWLKK